MNKIDLIGKKYGRLEVTSQGETKYKPSGAKVIYWTCRCDCGTQKDVMGEALRDGRVKSCGCLRDETHGLFEIALKQFEAQIIEEYKSTQENEPSNDTPTLIEPQVIKSIFNEFKI